MENPQFGSPARFGRLGGYPEGSTNFDLPDTTAIMQMIGQMPRREGKSLLQDAENFFYGCDDHPIEGVPNVNWAEFKSRFPLVANSENISGLNQLPLGLRSNDKDANYFFYLTNTGFGWKMKKEAQVFGINNIQKVNLNYYTYHFHQARYCRKMSPSETGYEVWVNTTTGLVVKQLSQPSGSVRVENGLERGIALRWSKGKKVLKSWSEIQQEAAKLRSEIVFFETQHR